MIAYTMHNLVFSDLLRIYKITLDYTSQELCVEYKFCSTIFCKLLSKNV